MMFAAGFAALAAILGACSSTFTMTSGTPAESTTTTAAPAFPAYVATAKVPSVPIYSAPGGTVTRTLPNPDLMGSPLTFLVVTTEGPWLDVQLPIRPNGSTGWIQASQVVVKGDSYRLDVHLGAHQLQLYRFGQPQQSFPVGVGVGQTPTPGGTYYLRMLIKTINPAGDYGPYAFGLSGYSNVLQTFNGGQGIIGLHGTNDPASVGHDVSHGCIRMYNSDITQLARQLPLGTPVRILT
jgi:lipoprotein-anchoring transpeptidase ErfK/SrfK